MSRHWDAWQSAVLAIQDRAPESQLTPLQRKFWKAYRNIEKGWVLYAIEARHNRREVLVEKLNGEKVWVDVELGKSVYAGMDRKYDVYKIREEFQIQRARLEEYQKKGWNPTERQLIEGIQEYQMFEGYKLIALKNTPGPIVTAMVIKEHEFFKVSRDNFINGLFDGDDEVLLFGIKLRGRYIIGPNKEDLYADYLRYRDKDIWLYDNLSRSADSECLVTKSR